MLERLRRAKPSSKTTAVQATSPNRGAHNHRCLPHTHTHSNTIQTSWLIIHPSLNSFRSTVLHTGHLENLFHRVCHFTWRISSQSVSFYHQPRGVYGWGTRRLCSSPVPLTFLSFPVSANTLGRKFPLVQGEIFRVRKSCPKVAVFHSLYLNAACCFPAREVTDKQECP